jgi:hypothetical protein
MNQTERTTNGQSSRSDGAKSATLPTKNSPAGDTNPKRGGDIKPGQPEVAGKGKMAAGASSGKEKTTGKAADEPWNDGKRR